MTDRKLIHSRQPQRTRVPAGFMDWLRDLESAALDGTAALDRAYAKGTPEMQDCLAVDAYVTYRAMAELADVRIRHDRKQL